MQAVLWTLLVFLVAFRLPVQEVEKGEENNDERNPASKLNTGHAGQHSSSLILNRTTLAVAVILYT
jgi:hypothetical protein